MGSSSLNSPSFEEQDKSNKVTPAEQTPNLRKSLLFTVIKVLLYYPDLFKKNGDVFIIKLFSSIYKLFSRTTH
jgi:hypothetical protein